MPNLPIIISQHQAQTTNLQVQLLKVEMDNITLQNQMILTHLMNQNNMQAPPQPQIIRADLDNINYINPTTKPDVAEPADELMIN